MSAREYVVGLPVVITVDDHGSVTYEIDTSEAGAAIFDDLETDVDEVTLIADRERIDFDHVSRVNNNRPAKLVTRR